MFSSSHVLTSCHLVSHRRLFWDSLTDDPSAPDRTHSDEPAQLLTAPYTAVVQPAAEGRLEELEGERS
ncbi:hypothetical protein ABVT39_017355, partial [Epinephelus coioides]